MTSLKKYIDLQYIYLTLKLKKNISIWAPISAAHIDIFKFIQKIIFDYNTCTVKWFLLTGNVDRQ